VNGQMAFACIATSLAGALGAFLIFNFNPARIFMGDTGSLVLGLLNAVLVIQFINFNTSNSSALIHVDSAPAVGFAILFVPLFDTLRVFSLRIFHGESPFTPDRNHIHHILLRLGLGHKRVTFFLLAANVFVAVGAYYLQFLGSNWLLGIILSSGFVTVSLLVNIYGKMKVKMVDGTITGNKNAKGRVRFISYITKEAANQN
jgi:UDP-N-acetylmuramyl pentapeptide phosphotransferase/UDP-N-acetylglucosamine-1-phosphate transferase